MKRVCAWCEIEMEPTAGDSAQVTHGICPPCFANLMAQVGAAARVRTRRDADAAELSSYTDSV